MNGNERARSIVQFVKFNFVGVVNTLLDVALFALLIGLGAHYFIAQALSYGAGMVNSFLLNKYWTFRSEGPPGAASGKSLRLPVASGESPRSSAASGTGGEALRFVLLNFGTFGLSLLLLAVFSGGFGMHPLAAKGIVLIFTTAVNFAGSKWWVFRRRNTASMPSVKR